MHMYIIYIYIYISKWFCETNGMFCFRFRISRMANGEPLHRSGICDLMVKDLPKVTAFSTLTRHVAILLLGGLRRAHIAQGPYV